MDSAILEQERISFSIALDQRGVDCRNGAPHLLSAPSDLPHRKDYSLVPNRRGSGTSIRHQRVPKLIR